MAQIPLVEALARLRRIDDQIAKKQRFILIYLLRRAELRDPLEREGGTAEVLRRELHSLDVLTEQKIEIRRAIQEAYNRTEATVGRQTRTVRDWLVWRREAAPQQARFLSAVRERIDEARRAADRAAARRTRPETATPGAFFVNLDEHDLIRDAEFLEETLGALEGQLSLKSATAAVAVPPEDAWRTGMEETIDLLLKKTAVDEAVGRAAAPPPAVAPINERRLTPTPMASGGVSEEVRRLARDPAKKIHAIKLHREQTGLGLKEAKDAVEAFIASGK